MKIIYKILSVIFLILLFGSYLNDNIQFSSLFNTILFGYFGWLEDHSTNYQSEGDEQ